MLKRACVTTILLMGMAMAVGQPAITVETDPDVNPWTHLNLKNDPNAFQFIVVGDRTGGERKGVFSEAMRKINLLQPEFVMSVGDLIDGYTDDQAELNRQWEELTDFVNRLEMPFFYVPGNHDISNAVMADEWRKRFGRAYYHFVYKNVLFLCINSEDPPASHMSDEQIEYFRKALEENPNVRWTLLFLHKPLWAEDPVKTNWGKMEELLQDRPYTVFAGHWHNYKKFQRNNRTHIVLATIGGGSAMRGVNYGEFDHIAWITMTDNGPLVANVMLDGIWSEDVMSESLASFLKPVLDGAAVTSDALAFDPQAAEATVRVRLTNHADIPMQVHLAAQPGTQWNVEPMNAEREVQPNSVEYVELKLAKTDQAIQDLSPLPIGWTVSYPSERAEPVTVRGVHRIIAETTHQVARRSEPVNVDGRLDEWAELPFDAREPGQLTLAWENWQGPADCSFSFAVASDDENIYVAVRTVDDWVVARPGGAPNRQDGVEISLDPRAERERNAADGKAILRISMSPGDDAASTIFPRNYTLPDGVKAVCVKTEEGHAAELAIPIRFLREAQGEDWKGFRLNVAAYDHDSSPAEGHVYVWWRPKWDTPANYANSGTFAR